MATAGEMIATVSGALNVPEATVASYYRVLREEGLVTKGGRGPSAPDLSALDAARLLIALMSADSLAEGAAITDLMGNATCDFVIGGDPDDPGSGSFESLTFEEALEWLLSQEAEKRGGGPQAPAPFIFAGLDLENIKISVTASTLSAMVSTNESQIQFDFTSNYEVTDANEWRDMSIRDRLLARSTIARLIVIRQISRAEIRDISMAIDIDGK
jgi:hypothetical protein